MFQFHSRIRISAQYSCSWSAAWGASFWELRRDETIELLWIKISGHYDNLIFFAFRTSLLCLCPHLKVATIPLRPDAPSQICLCSVMICFNLVKSFTKFKSLLSSSSSSDVFSANTHTTLWWNVYVYMNICTYIVHKREDQYVYI